MSRTQLLFNLYIVYQVFSTQKTYIAGTGLGLELRDAEAVRKWQIPQVSAKNGIRTGRKFKDLDRLFNQEKKHNINWGWQPDIRFKELDLEDDPELIKLDHNYKAFVEEEDVPESIVNRDNIYRKSSKVDKRTSIRKSNSKYPGLETTALVQKLATGPLFQTGLRRSSSLHKRHKTVQYKRRSSGKKGKHSKRSFLPVDNSPVYRIQKRSSLSLDADDAITTARAAIASLERKRQLSQMNAGVRRPDIVKRDQVRVFSLNGVSPASSQLVSQNNYKEKELWESRQEALRLLRGAGVNLGDTNKNKLAEAFDGHKDANNPLQDNVGTKPHDPVQNKVPAQVVSLPKAATKKAVAVQGGGLKPVANRVKGDVDKHIKGASAFNDKKAKPTRGRLNVSVGTTKSVNMHNDKAMDYTLNKPKPEKVSTEGQLTQRTKIESPEPSRKEKMRIVPSNVARAVAMAMEQLRRDKMWGKVFVHVLPSGKLKVMVQETKKMEDD